MTTREGDGGGMGGMGDSDILDYIEKQNSEQMAKLHGLSGAAWDEVSLMLGVAGCCSALQGAAVRCRVLQCVAGC